MDVIYGLCEKMCEVRINFLCLWNLFLKNRVIISNWIEEYEFKIMRYDSGSCIYKDLDMFYL